MTDLVTAGDKRRDDAARAAWLYFIGGRTQDEIATQLDVSRQAAQRLVSFAVSEKLIKFRLDHPIAACMDLAARLAERYGLEFCDVIPSDPGGAGAMRGVAIATAARLERQLAAKTPTVICMGTGRTMRAVVDEMDKLDRPQHKVVSLVGSMAAGGPASPYEVVLHLAEKIDAQRYPMPAPVFAESVRDREVLQDQRSFAILRELRAQARASFFGIGEVAWHAPIHREGFVNDAEIASLIELGAVGEITGWSFDAEGQVLDCPVNDRVTSLPLERPAGRLSVVAGAGANKIAPLAAALRGGLASALITDETTAAAVLDF